MSRGADVYHGASAGDVDRTGEGLLPPVRLLPAGLDGLFILAINL